MTWNRTLWNEIGGVIGTEALQKMHSTINSKAPHPGLTYFTPNINIFRDPRWGRGQETPGEDPYLTSHYAAIMVMSLQYGDQYLKQLLQGEMDSSSAADNHQQKKPHIAATCKHFAAYSLETNRLNFSAEIHDQRDWNDAYLPAFDACIHAGQFLLDYFGTAADMQVSIGGAVGVMCSYNAINQIPACANPAFLQDRLRQQWSFPGYVLAVTVSGVC
jgi:beta-glucosidase-like glycosyl hydrolase